MVKYMLYNRFVKIEVQNGDNTLFWRDRWIGVSPLQDVATQKINLVDSYKLVKDYWRKGEGWIWEEFQNTLPQHALSKTALILIREDVSSHDSPCWVIEFVL